MDEQIGDCEYRLVFILSYDDLDLGPVFFDHDAVDSHRNGHPLVLLDAAVIMGVEVAEAVALIERILLDVDAGRIDMGAQNIHAAFDRLLTDMVEDQGLAVVLGVDLISRFERSAFSDAVGQVPVAGRLRHLDRKAHALPLGLAPVQTVLVAGAHLLHFLSLRVRIYFPKTFLSCHVHSPFYCFCIMLFRYPF